MEIEKLKINQGMRKEATRAAIQHKFKKRVEDYHHKLKHVIQLHVLGHKDNKEAIAAYNQLGEKLKRLVRVQNTVYLKKTTNDKGATDNIMLAITSNMDFLKVDSENHFPFCTRREVSEYAQSVDLPFSYPLVENYFTFDLDKIPVKIQKQLDIRKELMDEINEFAKNTYHALCHVKNIKEVRENIPALEQFISIPEKQFTQMVPYSFFQKVNKSVNA